MLIIDSGNLVHNLRQSTPKLIAGDATPYNWAVDFDEWSKTSSSVATTAPCAF